MADETQNDDNAGVELSEESARLAALGRGEEPPAAGAEGEQQQEQEKPARPDHVPEKFWNAETGEVNTEALLKSYSELEKMRNKPADPPAKEGGEEESGEEQDGDEKAAEAAAALDPEVLTSAQAEYAEKGELSEDTRKAIIAGGIPEATLDTYLAGVAALSAQMSQAIYDAAGGEEAYTAAVAWARENWSAEEAQAFDGALDNAALRKVAIAGLMADYTAANGSPEGSLTRPGVGADKGDLYTDKDEFLRDLDAANNEPDGIKSALLRKAAVAKLERSQKAKSVGHVTPRTGLAAFQ